MKAVVLAGGKGTRLKPYTTCIPKPLMPIGDIPILEVVLTQLKRDGFDEIYITVGYLAHLIQAFFGDGSRLGIKLRYSHEAQPLGTAGPIAMLLNELDDDFLVINGDVLTTLDYRSMYLSHKQNKAAATIAVYKREVPIDFGVIQTDGDILIDYIEKPTYSFEVSMGVNVLNPNIIMKYIVAGKKLDMPELIIRMKNNNELVMCYREACYWLDIGRIEDYETAIGEFESRRESFLGCKRKQSLQVLKDL